MSPAVYVTIGAGGVVRPEGVVHLADESATGWADKTLCGRSVPLWAEYGDETISGIRADCKTCKAALRAKQAV